LGWARSEEPGATSDERRGRTVPAQTATLKATKQILGEALVNIHIRPAKIVGRNIGHVVTCGYTFGPLMPMPPAHPGHGTGHGKL